MLLPVTWRSWNSERLSNSPWLHSQSVVETGFKATSSASIIHVLNYPTRGFHMPLGLLLVHMRVQFLTDLYLEWEGLITVSISVPVGLRREHLPRFLDNLSLLESHKCFLSKCCTSSSLCCHLGIHPFEGFLCGNYTSRGESPPSFSLCRYTKSWKL